jgi:hypothetical protein
MLFSQNKMYSTTSEYRQFLRRICCMEPGKLYSDQDYQIRDPVDEETQDEFTYDEVAMSRFLDRIYTATKTNPLFQTLYIHAAALMFSEDPEIGLAVLCSYDYLADFYACFAKFESDPESDPKQFGSMEEYARLYKTLTKKSK